MAEMLAGLLFALALVLYTGASLLFYLEAARHPDLGLVEAGDRARSLARRRVAPRILAAGAVAHTGYVVLASLFAHVCPMYSVHYLLSVAALFATTTYLVLRARFRVDALGLLISPIDLTLVIGTYLLGKPPPGPRFSPVFVAVHILANTLGVALVLLAALAALLYLFQEKRIKQKRHAITNLPPLDTLDRAEHKFLAAGFLLLTLGVLSGTYWAHRFELGGAEELTRAFLGYLMWILIGAVLLLRSVGWRGRRSAYGTLVGVVLATVVMVLYMVHPTLDARRELVSQDRGNYGA
jgi:ABC-type uncharacterized transport system permease subunit